MGLMRLHQALAVLLQAYAAMKNKQSIDLALSCMNRSP